MLSRPPSPTSSLPLHGEVTRPEPEPFSISRHICLAGGSGKELHSPCLWPKTNRDNHRNNHSNPISSPSTHVQPFSKLKGPLSVAVLGSVGDYSVIQVTRVWEKFQTNRVTACFYYFVDGMFLRSVCNFHVYVMALFRWVGGPVGITETYAWQECVDDIYDATGAVNDPSWYIRFRVTIRVRVRVRIIL